MSVNFTDIAAQMGGGVTPAQVEWMVRYGTPAAFAQTISRGRWKRLPHLSYISQVVVEAIAASENPEQFKGSDIKPYVIVDAPPRHGKSELISKWVPTWYLNKYPERNVMMVSYGHEHAVKFGGAVRDLILENQDQLSVSLSRNSKSAHRWSTTAGGGMIAAGGGGALTGRGGNLIIIDDPLKNDQEAESATKRESLWEWFQSTVWTRKEKPAAVIILATRWNIDDLSGRLLERFPHMFRHVHLPAIAEANDPVGRAEGEALWPERFPVEVLEEQKELMGSYWFNSLYMGNPITRDGGYFDPDWFERVEKVTVAKRTIRFWDMAGSASVGTADPDYTAGVKIQRDAADDFTVLDVKHFRKNPMDALNEVVRTAHEDGPGVEIYIEQEPGSAGKYLIVQVQRMLPKFRVRGFRSTGPKEAYWDAVSAKAEARRIKIKADPAWNDVFLREMGVLPSGKHDDIPDAACKGVSVMSKKNSWGLADSRTKTEGLSAVDEALGKIGGLGALSDEAATITTPDRRLLVYNPHTERWEPRRA